MKRKRGQRERLTTSGVRDIEKNIKMAYETAESKKMGKLSVILRRNRRRKTMFEIKENKCVLPDGTGITTYSRDIVSADILYHRV